jgi:serine---pyruvate transaminase
MIKKRLYTPGPTPVPEHVMLSMAEPMIHHRHPEFQEILASVNENLNYLFQTKQGVMTLTSSGTGAMEAAVSNLLSAGDTALFVNGGKFGERWGELLTGIRRECGGNYHGMGNAGLSRYGRRNPE